MGALDNLVSNVTGGGGTQDIPGSMVYLGNLGGGTTKYPSGQTQTFGSDFTTIAKATELYLNNPKLQKRWSQILNKYGFDADPLRAKTLWDISVAGASEWYTQSNNQQKITPEEYIGWYSRGQKKKPNLPTRQIYNYTPEEIGALINKSAESVLGRTITDEDKSEDWYQDINNAISKMVSKGTVTKVETKGGERVVTQTPGFSTEKAAATIEKKLREASPEDVARKERTDFASFLFGEIGKKRG